MLKIGLSDGATKKWGADFAYRAVAEAGFDGMDANLMWLLPNKVIGEGEFTEFCRDEQSVLEFAKPLGEAAKKYGVQNHMAHAPFPAGRCEEEYDARLWEIYRWCIHACDAIGSRYLVVHPVTGWRQDFPLALDEQMERSEKMYRTLIAAAKQYGVTILTENMFHTAKYLGEFRRTEAACSDISDACTMIDALNAYAGAEVFGFCLDTGHLLVLGKDVSCAVSQLGSRLKALHLHDNNGRADQHMIPYSGIQDWELFTDAIAASDYAGVLNFESGKVWTIYDPELLPDALRFLAEIGRFFARRIEEKRAAK